jgi:hypothetical protein
MVGVYFEGIVDDGVVLRLGLAMKGVTTVPETNPRDAFPRVSVFEHFTRKCTWDGIIAARYQRRCGSLKFGLKIEGQDKNLGFCSVPAPPIPPHSTNKTANKP